MLWLLRYPRLAVAAAGATAVLAIASACGPLFLSSAENGLLARTEATFCPSDVGFRVSTSGPLGGVFHSLNGARTSAETLFRRRDASIRERAGALPDVGSPTLTILKQAGSYVAGEAGRTANVRVISRDGALSHVDVVSSAGGSGVWVPDTVANDLHLRPGETLALANGPHTANVRVAGVYRDLARQPPTPYWCSLAYALTPQNAFASFQLPPLLIMDRATLFSIGAELRDFDVQFLWEVPAETQHLSLTRAVALASAMQRLGNRLERPRSSFGQSANSAAETEIPAIVESVRGTIGALRPPVQTLSLGARLVALLMLALAGLYWVDRRRSDVRLLSARGVGPGGIAARALVELLLVVVLGAALGWVAAVGVLGLFGPGPASGGAAVSAAANVAIATAAGLVLAASTTYVSARRTEEPKAVASGAWFRRIPWEVAVLAAAGLSLAEILSSSGAAGSSIRVDPLVLLFPILVLLGAAGLAARALRRAGPALRSVRTDRTIAFLAIRRLANAVGTTPALFVGVAVAVGVLTYASTLSGSVQATAEAKAEVFAGSDVSYSFTTPVTVPRALAGSATAVERMDSSTVRVSGAGNVEVLAIDRSTFADAAFWDPSFATPSLEDLLEAMEPSGGKAPVPVVAVGNTVPASGTIAFEDPAATSLGFRRVAVTREFPGMVANTPLIVLDQSVLPGGSPHLDQLWVRGDVRDADAVVRTLTSGPEAPIVLAESVASNVEATNDFLPLFWMFSFLRWIAIATGLVVLWGVLLQAESQERARRLAQALARRMGLRRRDSRLALGLEIAVPLLLATLAGAAVAWAAARTVFGTLDPKPELPPPALFRMSWGAVGATFLILIVGCVVLAAVLERSSRRANQAEVVRGGG
ncbi:MAG: FtsX-like permease family protein [Actinomycetota bacterium]